MEKTHWKKNIDSRYISGEDLRAGLRGLKPEMVVTVEKQNDAPTFDQQKQAEITKSALWLKEVKGGELYKPVILNTTNAKFFMKEFNSEYIEDWYGKPVVLYALPDKRHGFVARFKKYYAPATAKPDAAIKSLKEAKSLDELGAKWTALTPEERKLPAVLAEKESLKISLTPTK